MTGCMIVSRRDNPVAGRIVAPADKSITHRALFAGGLNMGSTRIVSPSTASDVLSSLRLLQWLGVDVDVARGVWTVHGAERRLIGRRLTFDCGNSGTTARIALGFLTGEHGEFTLVGDRSLSRRPMDRVAKPLTALGADITTTGGSLPALVEGKGGIVGSREMATAVGSAQVYTALAFAALRSELGVRLRRTKPMRDHTDRMFRHIGISTAIETGEEGTIETVGPIRISKDLDIIVPGDISGAAFPAAAALLVPGSELTIESVGLNPTRTAFLAALRAMGAPVEWEVRRTLNEEPSGDLLVRYSDRLRGISLGGPDDDPSLSVAEMLDELPLLALVASQAHGTTTVRGAGELRVKESDRIAATVALLGSLGITATELDDGFSITGPQPVRGGVTVDHRDDHRLCMTAAVAGLTAHDPVTIPEPHVAAVSYPAFWEDLGAITGKAF